jgi:hypothetical protein
MGLPLNNGFTRKIDLEFVDDAGKDEKVQKGSVTASSSDPSVATIAVDPSETFATITPADGADSGLDANGVPVDIVFTFGADADRSAGAAQISGTYSCPVVGANATSIKATEGGDTPKP